MGDVRRRADLPPVMECGAEMGEMEIVLDRESTAEVGHGEGVAVAIYVDDRLVRLERPMMSAARAIPPSCSRASTASMSVSMSETTDSPVEEGPRRSFYHDLLASD